MNAGGGVKYLQDGQCYLVGFNLDPGKYFAIIPVDEGSAFACEYGRGPGDSIVIYNRAGTFVENKEFASGIALSEFLDSVSADFLAYNGQSVYFEPGNLELPDEFTIIP